MNLRKWLRGPRMEYVAPAFIDRVSGRQVNYYRDEEGYWMARSPRDRFRMSVEDKGWFTDPEWLAWADTAGRR